MSQIELEMMVERFLACEMTLDEEREFIMLAATNPELFRTLRAYRLMEQALARNRDAMPDGDVAVRSHALALLNQVPAVPTGAADAVTRAGARAGEVSGMLRRSGRWLGIAVASIVGTAAGFLLHDVVLGPIGSHLDTPAATASGPPPVQTPPSSRAPQSSPSPMEARNAEPAANAIAGPDRRQHASSPAQEAEPASESNAARGATRTPLSARALEAKEHPSSPAAPASHPEHDSAAPPLRVTSDQRNDTTRQDSVSFRAKILIPKR